MHGNSQPELEKRIAAYNEAKGIIRNTLKASEGEQISCLAGICIQAWSAPHFHGHLLPDLLPASCCQHLLWHCQQLGKCMAGTLRQGERCDLQVEALAGMLMGLACLLSWPYVSSCTMRQL